MDELNEIRLQIMDRIQEYIRINGLISEFENHYLAFVLLPSYRVQQSIQMGNYLEQEYKRISDAIQSGMIQDSMEIDAEIKNILHHADFAFGDLPRNLYSELLRFPDPLCNSQEQDFFLAASQQEKLIKEFKKVVLPKVHADTSEAPFEEFHAVYDAYRKKDYLLLAAFVIQYRGELTPSEQERMTMEDRSHYRAVLQGLEQRLKRLKEDPTSTRLENSEKVLHQMRSQNLELRKAAVQEAERVLLLRECLEDLMRQKKIKRQVN